MMEGGRVNVSATMERAARTFVQGFLGVVTLSGVTAVDMNLLHQLEAGALAGAYAVLMAFAFPPRRA
jgi:hypothetical protein